MSSEQPGGDGHALSPGPARRGARAEPRGLPPPQPPPAAPPAQLGLSPGVLASPGSLGRDPEAGEPRTNRRARPRRRAGVWRRLDWLRQPSSRRIPLLLSNPEPGSFPFKTCAHKGI